MCGIAASFHMSLEFSLEVETCLSEEIPTQCLHDVLQWEKSELKFQFHRAWSGYHPYISMGIEIIHDFPDQKL